MDMKMMRGLALGLLVLVGAGCYSVKCDPRITVGRGLRHDIEVPLVVFPVAGSQQRMVQVNVQNRCTYPLPVEYRVVWLDAAAVEIPSVGSTWQRTVIAPRDTVRLQSSAPSPEGVDFRLYMQAPKN